MGAPPPAWLIFNDQAFPGYPAALETVQAHVDPAKAFPDLSPITVPDQAQFVIVIPSQSISEFFASVLPWNPQSNPLPLVASEGQSVNHTRAEEQGLSAFTLSATYPTMEQFLHVYIAFSQPSTNVIGSAHYLWRIISGEYQLLAEAGFLKSLDEAQEF